MATTKRGCRSSHFLYHLIIKWWQMIQEKGQLIPPNTHECQGQANVPTPEPSSVLACSHQDSRQRAQHDVSSFQGILWPFHLRPDPSPGICDPPLSSTSCVWRRGWDGERQPHSANQGNGSGPSSGPSTRGTEQVI